MSDDEVGVTIFSAIAGLISWVWWYGSILTDKTVYVAARRPALASLIVTPLLSFGLLYYVLKFWAAGDVRNDERYLTMYSLLGMAVSGIATFVPSWLGVSFRHDVLSRANHSAAWLYSGWTVAAMIAFAGANIGDGPGWWVVIVSSMLSFGTLLVIFVGWQFLANSLDLITIDRDLSTGLRMAAMFVACGCVLGISVAGDWVSVEATVQDFVQRAWPVLFILLLAAGFHWAMRPSPENPRPSVFVSGVVPGLLLLSIAVVCVVISGPRIVEAAK